MASGHMNRVKRPDTWLHRPMLQNVKKVLANPEPCRRLLIRDRKSRLWKHLSAWHSRSRRSRGTTRKAGAVALLHYQQGR